MDDWAQPLLDVIKAHPDWAAAVMFITAFGESFAFVSLLFPGTTVLIAAGTLLSGGTLPYASILVSAILGSFAMMMVKQLSRSEPPERSLPCSSRSRNFPPGCTDHRC